MSIEPFKYLLQPVAIERDESGQIVSEKVAEVLTVFSAAQAAEAITQFEAQLAEMGKEGVSSNGSDKHTDRDAVRD